MTGTRHAQDVTYLVQNRAAKREKLAILKGVSGFCQPGELFW